MCVCVCPQLAYGSLFRYVYVCRYRERCTSPRSRNTVDEEFFYGYSISWIKFSWREILVGEGSPRKFNYLINLTGKRKI